MKRCPTCTRVFEDDSLTYCLDDGSPLVSERSPSPDPEATVVTPSPQSGGSGDLQPTQYGQLPGKATINASQFQIPTMPTYNTAPQQRRVWPWVVAGIAVLGLIMIVVAAVIMIPMMASKSRNAPGGIDTQAPSVSPSEASKPPPPKFGSGTEAPTDEDAVLSQLTELEKQWTQANVDGDKDAIQRILADEYSGGNPPHNKQEYLDGLKPDSTVKSWELEDLQLDLNGDRASINGYLRQETTRGPEVYGFTDKFIWRDGRWQATGSRASRVK